MNRDKCRGKTRGNSSSTENIGGVGFGIFTLLRLRISEMRGAAKYG